MEKPFNLVEIQQVSKAYGSLVALNNINLKLEAGKIIGLLGPNGSGKTTLIKLLNGLLQPDYGQILIKGHIPSPTTKAIVSYLPDTTYLDENMKVSQAIELFRDFYADFDQERAYHLLEDLNIDPNSRMRHLS